MACSVCEIVSGHVWVMSRNLLGDVTPSTCRETDAEMGKCKFADSWLEKDEFKLVMRSLDNFTDSDL